MKKVKSGINKWLIILTLISIYIIFGLIACTNENGGDNQQTHTPVDTITQEPFETAVPDTNTPTTTLEPTPEPTATPIPTAIPTPNTSPGTDVSTHADYYGKKIVVLTFDDGPSWKTTEKLLDGLKERNVRATFFVTSIGTSDWDWNMDKKILTRMLEEGHDIGNHSQSHKNNLTKLSDDEIRKELSTVSERVKEMTGYDIKLFRPQGGWFNKKVVDIANMALVYWTLDTNDWRYLSESAIKEYAEKNSVTLEEAKEHNVKYLLDVLTGKLPNDNVYTGELKHGSILLLHDIYEGSVELALELIDELSKDGYVFLPLSEAAMTVGAAPAAGDAYKSIWEGYKISVK